MTLEPSSASACIVGLRVHPQRRRPQWYGIWFEDDAGRNRMAVTEGRIQWARSIAAARSIGAEVAGFRPPRALAFDAVCDIAATLHQFETPSVGTEEVVLLSLNLLDDFCYSIDRRSPQKTSLDRLAVQLTEGTPLPAAVKACGGSTRLLNETLADLGAVFVKSDF
jgi:hypothetical protein